MSLSDLLPDVILSTRTDAIVASDRNGVIQFWNPGAERIFGYTADDAVGHSLDIIIPERLRRRHWDGYRQTMHSGESRYGDADVLSVPALCKDGRSISVEFTIIPLKDERGQMIGIAAVMRDVSKRFEELRALRRKVVETTKVLSVETH